MSLGLVWILYVPSISQNVKSNCLEMMKQPLHLNVWNQTWQVCCPKEDCHDSHGVILFSRLAHSLCQEITLKTVLSWLKSLSVSWILSSHGHQWGTHTTWPLPPFGILDALDAQRLPPFGFKLFIKMILPKYDDIEEWILKSKIPNLEFSIRLVFRSPSGWSSRTRIRWQPVINARRL